MSSSVDLQAPKTKLALGGVVLGNNGWLVAPVTVTLTATDVSGTGIEAIEYSIERQRLHAEAVADHVLDGGARGWSRRPSSRPRRCPRSRGS